MRYSDHLRLPGKDSRAAVNHSDLTRLHTYPSALSSRTLPPKATPTHIPVIMPQLVPGCPGQIVIRRPDTPDTDEDDLMGEWPQEVVNAWPYRSPSVSPRHSPHHTPRHAPDVLRFADKDYMMPSHVRKILREEGIRDATAESWVKEREVWHWKSASLRHQEKSKNIKASSVKELPMINHQVSLVSGQQHYSTQHGTAINRASTQGHRGSIIVASADVVGYSQSEVSFTNFDTSPMTSSAALPATLTSSPTLPSALTPPATVPATTTSSAYLPATMTSSAYLSATMTSSDYLVTTKTSSVSLPDIVGSELVESGAVDMEPDSPDPQGDMPRLVLISSKVPRCQSMARAVIKDAHVTCLVYDFDRWCFQDILDECQHRLENDFNGCKARSVLLICKGGPGYLYMLRNFVLTPQKMGQPQYQCVRQFWYCLGHMLNKREPVIHIVGADLCSNKQGDELRRIISLSMPHSHVRIESIDDIDTEGQAKISLYFNYRKYLLWRSRTENVDDSTSVFDDSADDKSIKTCVEIENLRSITKL